MSRLVVLASVVLVACSNTPRPDFVVHLVDSMGGNPFTATNPVTMSTCSGGDVEVDVQQGTNAVLTTHGTLANGALGSLSVQIPSYGLPTTIEVTVSCSDGSRLIGATPRFLPVGYTMVDVVLGAPGSCARLSTPTLTAPREGLDLVTLHANVVAIGGLEGSAMPSRRVQVLDPLTLTFNQPAHEFDPPLDTATGLGHAVALGNANNTQIVVVTDVWRGIYETAPDALAHTLPLASLHHGAGSESAVIGLNGNGVAVIGGVADGMPQQGITWIDTTGQQTSGQLRVPRRRPAAAIVGANRLLVVGGQAMGDPMFEIMPLMSTTQSMTFDLPTGSMPEQRYGAIVVTDASHAHAWVGFGETAADGSGSFLSSSWVISGCSSTCTSVTAGPTVPMPRRDVAVVAHHVGMMGSSADVYETLVVGGDVAMTPTRQIDRIAFDDHGAVTLGTFGQLANLGGLSSVGAAEIGAGVFLVAGGVDDNDTAVQEVEVCFPAALLPITAAASM